LNSPRLWPRPRASSGSFFAPKSNTTTTRMKRVSGQPGMLIAIGRLTKIIDINLATKNRRYHVRWEIIIV
jgi:hypothetical protein